MRRRANSEGRFLSPAEVSRVLRAVLGTAREQGIPACVVGGLAMARYGSPRLTADVDVAATAPIGGLPRGQRLSFGGFATRVGRVPVDVIVRSDAYAGLYEAAVLASRNGLVLPEHLAAMKLAAGRSKDEDDLLFLLSTKLANRAALARTRRIVRQFMGQYALDSFDSFAEEAAWLRRGRGEARPRRRRRGV